VGWTTPEAAELQSPVVRYGSELGDRQVQQLLAHQNVFRLSWKKQKFCFFKKNKCTANGNSSF